MCKYTRSRRAVNRILDGPRGPRLDPGAGRGYPPRTMRCPACEREFPVGAEPPRFCPLCGRTLPEATRIAATRSAAPEASSTPSAPPPDRVGPYRLIGLLGRGGMGSVHDAEDPVSGRRVALKLVSPDLLASPEARERFRQEGRLASRIVHPRVVFVLAADLDGAQPYIAMERMPGETLQDRVDRSGPLPVEEAVARALDVLDGLREAHRLQVLHRDVKPSNCYLDGLGRAKVGDFGIARALDAATGLTRTGAFVGTPLYASPEQVRGAELDARTDVYSLAATLFYLLTGRPPFQGDDLGATIARILSEPPADPRALRPEVPTALAVAVLRGLEKDRAKRFRDLDEMRRALSPFVPARPGIGSVGLRCGAWLLDLLLFLPLALLIEPEFLAWATDAEAISRHTSLALWGAGTLLWLAYFAVTDGVWGGSLGKRLLGLRVSLASGLDAPGVLRGAARAAIWVGLVELPQGLLERTVLTGEVVVGWWAAWAALLPIGLAVLASTMRGRNGYRGLHDLLTGTRVIAVASFETDLPAETSAEVPEFVLPRTGEMPERVGPYRITGAVEWTASRRVLVGEDPTLGRPVRVVLWGTGEAPVASARRTLDRPARARWIGGSPPGEEAWDAFVASEGTPLPSWIGARGRVGWTEARPVLAGIVEECAHAVADGTLLRDLSAERVRVAAGGRPRIEDDGAPARDASAEAAASRSLALVREAAAWMLEGRRPAPPPPKGALRCHSCGAWFECIRPREEGLFQEAHCPTCDRWRPLPLVWQQRAFLWAVLAVFVVLLSLGIVGRGRYTRLFAVYATLGATYGLLKDLRLRLRDEDVARVARAPIPLHASEALDRACGDGPAMDRLARLGEDLALAATAPSRVGPGVRLAQALLLGTVLALPWFVMLAGSHLSTIEEMIRLQASIDVSEAALVVLSDPALLQDMVAAAGMEPPPVETGAALRARAERDLERSLAAWTALGPTGRLLIGALEPEEDSPVVRARTRFESERGARPSVQVIHLRADGKEVDGQCLGPHGFAYVVRRPGRDNRPPAHEFLAPSVSITMAALALVVFWPLLAGSGLSFRFAGLVLVRRSGARAFRLQCSLRSLVAWGPFAALLVGASVADLAAPSIAPTLRGLALALLPLWLLVVLRWPARGPHDVLAGTWVVRR